MMTVKILKLRLVYLVTFFIIGIVAAQQPDSLSALSEAGQQIQLSTYLEKNQVPLNRTVIFHIQLSWKGELSRYQIEPVSQPVLTNLLLKGSGSENRLEPQNDGSIRAVKSISYQFQPVEMGMAYVDGVQIKYVDRISGEEDQLTSQRVMVEIVDPLPEESGGAVRSVLYAVLFIIFFSTLIFFIIVYFRKRKLARSGDAPVIPIPESYLNKLAQEVDPRGTNLDEMAQRLSRIFREYLDEDFGIPARESSSSEIIEQIAGLKLDESDQQKLADLLKKLDLIKFAGKNVDPADFTNIYGTIEAFLLKRQNQETYGRNEVKEAE